MAMTERSRHKLFESFTGLVDDEQAVEEMLSYFPARDVEEPVTKEFLRAELQTEVSVLRSELHTEVGAVRIEVGELRSEMHREFAAVRAEAGELRVEMHREFGAVRTEMQQMMRKTQAWFVGTGISVVSLILAAIRLG